MTQSVSNQEGGREFEPLPTSPGLDCLPGSGNVTYLEHIAFILHTMKWIVLEAIYIQMSYSQMFIKEQKRLFCLNVHS